MREEGLCICILLEKHVTPQSALVKQCELSASIYFSFTHNIFENNNKSKTKITFWWASLIWELQLKARFLSKLLKYSRLRPRDSRPKFTTQRRELLLDSSVKDSPSSWNSWLYLTWSKRETSFISQSSVGIDVCLGDDDSIISGEWNALLSTSSLLLCYYALSCFCDKFCQVLDSGSELDLVVPSDTRAWLCISSVCRGLIIITSRQSLRDFKSSKVCIDKAWQLNDRAVVSPSISDRSTTTTAWESPTFCVSLLRKGRVDILIPDRLTNTR